MAKFDGKFLSKISIKYKNHMILGLYERITWLWNNYKMQLFMNMNDDESINYDIGTEKENSNK